MTIEKLRAICANVEQSQQKCRQHPDPRVRRDGFYERGAFYHRSTGKMICREQH